jgi:hypothetical protein
MTKNKAINALEKYVSKTFTEEQQENIGYFTDVENSDGYTWRMELNGKSFNLTYNYNSKKVMVH